MNQRKPTRYLRLINGGKQPTLQTAAGIGSVPSHPDVPPWRKPFASLLVVVVLCAVVLLAFALYVESASVMGSIFTDATIVAPTPPPAPQPVVATMPALIPPAPPR